MACSLRRNPAEARGHDRCTTGGYTLTGGRVMPDNRNKNEQQQEKQPIKKPEQVGNKNPKKEPDEDEDLDEQGEITQRNPRMPDDDQRR
jgi:hypothetical protein